MTKKSFIHNHTNLPKVYEQMSFTDNKQEKTLTNLERFWFDDNIWEGIEKTKNNVIHFSNTKEFVGYILYNSNTMKDKINYAKILAPAALGNKNTTNEKKVYMSLQKLESNKHTLWFFSKNNIDNYIILNEDGVANKFLTEKFRNIMTNNLDKVENYFKEWYA